MFDIKKAKKFDGITCQMYSDEYDKIIDCLEKAINECQEEIIKDNNSNLVIFQDKCYSLLKSLTHYSFFEKNGFVVHARLGFNELATLTNAVHSFSISPSEGNSIYSYGKWINSDKCRFWIDNTND